MIFDRLRLLAHLGRWRLTWNRRDTHRGHRVPGNPRFVSPREAVALIPDGAVLADSGLGGNADASILYWAIREMYQETGSPADLTVVSLGGHGSRGRLPGTLDELAVAGLCTTLITGHTETYRAMLRLAARGEMALHVLPQGTIAALIDAQARGGRTVLRRAGLGTEFDPRVGRGSPLVAAGSQRSGRSGRPMARSPDPGQLVSAENTPDGERLRYRLPPIDVAIFNLPAADRHGNIYATGAALVGEALEIARAARANGGRVLANVGLLVEPGSDRPYVPADLVDAVVLHPDTPQTLSVPHRRHWPFLATGSQVPVRRAMATIRLFNRVAGASPRRTRIDRAIARLAATVVAPVLRPGMRLDVGTGLPEEVTWVLYRHGLLSDVEIMNESGVCGGVPAPGVFFGAAINPDRIVSSIEAFRLFDERLDVALLGMLQADSDGNVNVARRDGGPERYVGPGGFVDLTAAARTIVFVGGWMVSSKISLARPVTSRSGGGGGRGTRGARVRIRRPGPPKFVDRVDEISFRGADALAAGKTVYYCTSVGAFRLTDRGMLLERVMPGVDIARDILAGPMRVVLPPGGVVPVVTPDVLTGRGFRLPGPGGA